MCRDRAASEGKTDAAAPCRAPPHSGERAARGKAARAATPRGEQGDWAPASDRRDPVELLEEQGATRVAELVPIRYGRMLVSPFTFYRGGAYLMAADLAAAPRTGLEVQLCGDAHLSNFGAFAAPDRRLIFSVNDFDETLPGPFEWDVKRLVASFEVAGRDRGFKTAQRKAINTIVTASYREAMHAYAAMTNFELWYSRIDVEPLMEQFAADATPKELKRLERNVAKTRSKDSVKAFGKLTRIVDGEPQIVGDPPLIVPIEDVAGDAVEVDEFLRGVIRSYRRTLPADRRRLLERFRYVHAARKVVGVGSVGTRAWIMLMLGRDETTRCSSSSRRRRHRCSSRSSARASSPTTASASSRASACRRRRATSCSAGSAPRTCDGVRHDFYVRQLWDMKGSAIVELMSPPTMTIYAQLCGRRSPRRTHARAIRSRSRATSAPATASTGP